MSISTRPSAEEAQALREQIERVNADAAANWDDPEWRRAMKDELETTVYEGFAHENILHLLSEVEVVGETDRITVEEISGLEVFWTSDGGQVDSSTLTEEKWEMKRDRISFQVDELEDKMRLNFAKWYGAIADLAIERVDAAINSRLIRLYQSVVSGLSPYLIQHAGVSLPAINTAIDEVMDESKSEQVSIVGRGVMVNQIMDELAGTGLFLPETNEQMIRLGRLGTYRGANIVKLVNHKDANKQSYIPGNELYIAGVDAAKTGFFGGLRTKEWTDADGGDYWHFKGHRNCGFALHHPERVRRYVDTSRNP